MILGIQDLMAVLPQDIVDTLSKIDSFSSLEKDWDGEGTILPTAEVVARSATFLIFNSIQLHRLTGDWLKAPDASPCYDGSIDLHWKIPNGRQLLVNLKHNKTETASGSFCGYDKERVYMFDGELDITGNNIWLLAFLLEKL